DLYRRRQQVAVIGDDPERVARTEIVQVGQEELVEARRTGVEQAETVAARQHVEERLDLAIHQELVAEDAVQVEQVERQQAGGRIVDLVGERQRNIELRETGETESGGFVAGIELVEQAIESEQALVGILRGEIHPVIVVPQRAERFID